MSNDMFNAILRELADIGYTGRIEFYIYNEPLADPRLRELIGQARDILPRACLMINTNGDYIKARQDVDSLIVAGLNQIGINVYSSEKRERVLLDIVSGLPSDGSLYQNIGASGLSVKVVPKYRLMKDGVTLPGVSHISNRAGNIPSFVPPLEHSMRRMCTRPFRFLNISWQGDAMLCCNDYYVEIEIGNIADVGVLGVWNSDMFNLYRLKLQNKDRRLPLCSCCDFTGGYYSHMIHPVTFGAIDNVILDTDLTEWKDFYVCIDEVL